MALIDCKECGRDVSTLAASCPHCGAPLRMKAAPEAAKAAPAGTTAHTDSGMGWFAKLSIGVAGLLIAFFIFSPTISKEQSAAYDHVRVVEAECRKMMEDSALGRDRQMTRQLCDLMKTKAEQELATARARR